MTKNVLSNTLLGLGALLLVVFITLEIMGLHSDALLPAAAAFFIGCTAVLDRMQEKKLEQSR